MNVRKKQTGEQWQKTDWREENEKKRTGEWREEKKMRKK
jgi:hypothetical protein